MLLLLALARWSVKQNIPYIFFRRLDAQRRKERQEAHLYQTIHVAMEDLFCGHQGYDLFDQDKVNSKLRYFSILLNNLFP